METIKEVELGNLNLGDIFKYGGVDWVVLDKDEESALCLARDILFEQPFDEGNFNNWETSTLRKYLNCELLNKMIESGAKSEDFFKMEIDLTSDDGLNDYGSCDDIISLISCQQYRKYRSTIPNVGKWWWTSTALSTKNNGYSYFARLVSSDGTLLYNDFAFNGNNGVRPLCALSSKIIISQTNNS